MLHNKKNEDKRPMHGTLYSTALVTTVRVISVWSLQEQM
jgi:hypothetical protein